MEFRNYSNRISEGRATQFGLASNEGFVSYTQKQRTPADGKLLQVFQRICRIMFK